MQAPDWPVGHGPVPPATIEERADLFVNALLSEGVPLSPELFDAALRLLEPIPDLAAYVLRRFVALDLSLRESIAVSGSEVELARYQAKMSLAGERNPPDPVDVDPHLPRSSASRHDSTSAERRVAPSIHHSKESPSLASMKMTPSPSLSLPGLFQSMVEIPRSTENPNGSWDA